MLAPRCGSAPSLQAIVIRPHDLAAGQERSVDQKVMNTFAREELFDSRAKDAGSVARRLPPSRGSIGRFGKPHPVRQRAETRLMRAPGEAHLQIDGFVAGEKGKVAVRRTAGGELD